MKPMSSMRSASSTMKRRHRIQPHMLLLHQVEQAARRRHQDVHAMRHGVDLDVLADAAQDHGHASD